MIGEDDFLEAAYEDRHHFDEPLDFEAGYDGYTETDECDRHSWVAGMMHVHDEDLESVVEARSARGETVECQHCEAKPQKGVDY